MSPSPLVLAAAAGALAVYAWLAWQAHREDQDRTLAWLGRA